MLKNHKNAIFNAIKTSKFNTDKFDISESVEEDHVITIIKIKDTPFKFLIGQPSDNFVEFRYQYVLFSPNYVLTNILPRDRYIDFTDVLYAFKRWLNNHINSYFEEENEIDLWTEYKSVNKILNLEKIDFEDQSYFSSGEKEQIKSAINELKLSIAKNFQLSNEEISQVNKRLDYLSDAPERLNKFDWKSLIIPTILNIATALSLNTQQGKELFELFKQVFQVIPKLIGG